MHAGPLCEYDRELCASLRREEWDVLESIYPECIPDGTTRGSTTRLEVSVELSETTVVLVQDDVPTSNLHLTLTLSTLPPIVLDILLPPNYPYEPPQVNAIRATHSWLSLNISVLRELLVEKWEKGEGVLYTWVEWIRTGDFLDDLNMISEVDGKRTVSISHATPDILQSILAGYDKSAKAARFSQNSYQCEVCLTSIKGARCIQLSCEHVFCRSCLEDFWGLCIKEGDVGRVGCPDFGCVKEHREASEEELRRVVSEEEVLRWKWLRMKRALERDPTLVYCPMPQCQTPVPRASNVEEGSSWERLRTCPECGYSFCAYCKRTWHGPVNHCPISTTKAVLMEYMSLSPGSVEQKRMEMRFGITRLQKLVDEYEQDKALEAWLEKSAGVPCPGCELRVEKHSGCNHMTCVRCHEHYCYRCGAHLNPKQPYKHFSTPGRCFEKLFDYDPANNDHEWQPVEGFEVL